MIRFTLEVSTGIGSILSLPTKSYRAHFRDALGFSRYCIFQLDIREPGNRSSSSISVKCCHSSAPRRFGLIFIEGKWIIFSMPYTPNSRALLSSFTIGFRVIVKIWTHCRITKVKLHSQTLQIASLYVYILKDTPCILVLKCSPTN